MAVEDECQLRLCVEGLILLVALQGISIVELICLGIGFAIEGACVEIIDVRGLPLIPFLLVGFDILVVVALLLKVDILQRFLTDCRQSTTSGYFLQHLLGHPKRALSVGHPAPPAVRVLSGSKVGGQTLEFGVKLRLVEVVGHGGHLLLLALGILHPRRSLQQSLLHILIHLQAASP